MFKKIVLSVVGILYCSLAGCAINPLTGENELMFFSKKHDVEIGRQFAPEVEKQLGERIDNNDLQDYLDRVGKRLVWVCHRRDMDYHFVAVNHKSVNALALPGGYVFITKGMLKKLESEAQLAGILAHEIAHVVARDTMNAISRETGMALLLSAAVMATEKAPPADAMRVAQVAHQILSLSYNRKDERQADLGGLLYMVRAGYNPYGMVETMQMLESQHDSGPPQFFSTHPSGENRIRYLTRKIEKKYPDQSGLKVGQEDYRKAVLEALGG